MKPSFPPLRAPHAPRPSRSATGLLLLGLSMAPCVAHAQTVTFATKADYGTGVNPYSVTSADFNGDGKSDLASANVNSSTVSVLLGKGDGTFNAKADYGTGSSPVSVFSADFNGDGKSDLAIANFYGGNVSVLLNKGDGTFANKADYVTGSNPFSVFSADFNGDGKSDLAIADVNSSTVSVLLNKGDGTFNAKADYGTGASPYSVFSADFNGDGKRDLASANRGSNTVSVLLNKGDGTFATKVDYSTGSNPFSVFSADFNGDGKSDLAIANVNSDTVSVLLNKGDGTFNAKADYGTGVAPYSVFSADFNGDGKSDLAIANVNSSTVSVLLGKGDGTFANKADYGTGVNPYSVTSADFNGDGKRDLAIANVSSSTVSVLLNTTVFAPTLTSFAPARGPVGSSVVITGTGFTGATAVTFNGVAASSFTVNSATQITAIVPSGNATGKIAVTSSNGTGTSADSFTVTETPSLVVTTTSDVTDDTDGVTSLREAITLANSNADSSTVSFDATAFAQKQTIALTQGRITIDQPLTLNGSAAGVAVAGGDAIFQTNAAAEFFRLNIQGTGINARGIENYSPSVVVENCALSVGSEGISNRLPNSTVNVRNSTFSNLNDAIYSNKAGFNLFVENSTLAGNNNGITASQDDNISIYSSIVAGNTENFNFTPNPNAIQFSLTSGNPKLGPLQDNGGATLTMAPLKGSPAIDKGNVAPILAIKNAVSAGATDQIGQKRPFDDPNIAPAPNGDNSDIGAFEVQSVLNQPPTVSSISISTNEDTAFKFAANTFDKGFKDPDGDSLQNVRIDSMPASGKLSYGDSNTIQINQIIARADLNQLVYTPDSNFNGTTSFSFNASDGLLFAANSATLTLNVAAVNDAPNFAVGANQTVNEDACSQLVAKFATGISAGPADESTQTLIFGVSNDNNALFSTQPSINAAGDLIYRAADNANGKATVSVQLKDDGGTANGGADLSATQTFTITVNPVNDAPVAVADKYFTDENTTLTVSAADGVLSNDGDIDSPNLTAVLDNTTSRGTLTLNADGSFNYVPETLFSGIDSFSYHARDGALSSKTVNVTLGVNQTPQQINFGVSITPKSPTTNSVLTATPVIADGKGVSYSYRWNVNKREVQNGPSNTLDLSLANQGDKGDDVSVFVTATRDIDGGTAGNNVSVANSAPFAFSQSGAAQGGVAATFTLRGADFDNETLTFKRVGGPTNGSANIVNNANGSATLTYTARRNFGGVETIRFVAIDESGRPSAPATLSINVTRQAPPAPANRAPSANNVTASTRSGVQVAVPLSGTDPDGDALTFKRVGGPTNGTGEIRLDSDGVYKMFYTPRTGFVGNEVIRFVAIDTAGKPSPVATMTINVSGSSASAALQSAPSANNS